MDVLRTRLHSACLLRFLANLDLTSSPSSISFNKGPSEVRLTDPLTRERGCFSAKITFPEGECLLRFPANLDPSFICFNECPGLWTPLASHDT